MPCEIGHRAIGLRAGGPGRSDESLLGAAAPAARGPALNEEQPESEDAQGGSGQTDRKGCAPALPGE